MSTTRKKITDLDKLFNSSNVWKEYLRISNMVEHGTGSSGVGNLVKPGTVYHIPLDLDTIYAMYPHDKLTIKVASLLYTPCDESCEAHHIRTNETSATFICIYVSDLSRILCLSEERTTEILLNHVKPENRLCILKDQDENDKQKISNPKKKYLLTPAGLKCFMLGCVKDQTTDKHKIFWCRIRDWAILHLGQVEKYLSIKNNTVRKALCAEVMKLSKPIINKTMTFFIDSILNGNKITLSWLHNKFVDRISVIKYTPETVQTCSPRDKIYKNDTLWYKADMEEHNDKMKDKKDEGFLYSFISNIDVKSGVCELIKLSSSNHITSHDNTINKLDYNTPYISYSGASEIMILWKIKDSPDDLNKNFKVCLNIRVIITDKKKPLIYSSDISAMLSIPHEVENAILSKNIHPNVASACHCLKNTSWLLSPEALIYYVNTIIKTRGLPLFLYKIVKLWFARTFGHLAKENDWLLSSMSLCHISEVFQNSETIKSYDIDLSTSTNDNYFSISGSVVHAMPFHLITVEKHIVSEFTRVNRPSYTVNFSIFKNEKLRKREIIASNIAAEELLASEESEKRKQIERQKKKKREKKELKKARKNVVASHTEDTTTEESYTNIISIPHTTLHRPMESFASQESDINQTQLNTIDDESHVLEVDSSNDSQDIDSLLNLSSSEEDQIDITSSIDTLPTIHEHINKSTYSDLSETQPDKIVPKELQCLICFEEKRDVYLVPCGHTQFCLKCMNLLDRCPMCRERM